MLPLSMSFPAALASDYPTPQVVPPAVGRAAPGAGAYRPQQKACTRCAKISDSLPGRLRQDLKDSNPPALIDSK